MRKRGKNAGGAAAPVRRKLRAAAERFWVEALEGRRLLSAAVLGYHNDLASTGQNLNEVSLTPGNVNVTSFGKYYSVPVDGQIYAQPLYVPGVNVTGGAQPGVHNVVYVATEHDSLYAIDSDTGAVLWKDSFLVADQALAGTGNGVSVTTVPAADVLATNLYPEVGITGTPAIDPGNGFLYVVAKTKQVVNGDASHPYFVQTLYKVGISDGSFGGVVIADTAYDLTTQTATGYVSGPTVNDPNGNAAGVIDVGGVKVTPFDALRELQRTAITLYGGSVYVSFASHGDTAPYHGFILGYDETSLAPAAVFCTTPDGEDGGIWMSGGEIAVDPQGYMYLETGNGTFDTTLDAKGFPVNGDYGDTFLKLAVDPTTDAAHQNVNGWGLKVVDYFTPYNQAALSSADVDLGAGGPLVLPDEVGGVMVGSAAHPHLLVGAGKEGKIYLIDRDHMGGYSATTDDVVQELTGLPIRGSFDTPAFYFDGVTPRIYYVAVIEHARSFTIENGLLSADTNSADDFGGLGGTASLSANGTTNGIAWYLDPGSSQLRAYDATNLGTELWNSGQAAGGRDALGKVLSFSTPTVAEGRVYVGGYNALTVYGVLAPPTAPPQSPQGLTAAAVSGVEVDLTWTDTSDDEGGFGIEVSTNGGATWSPAGSAGVNSTGYRVTGLTPGTSYAFRVYASNSAGASGYSNVASATTVAPQPVLDFSSGFSVGVAGLSMNGGTAYVSGSALVLTDEGVNETTSVFSKSAVKTNYFTTSFTFQLMGGGEGFAFVIQGNSPGALGGGGGDLGYGGMGFSAAVKFDLFNDDGEGRSSTGLYVNGASPADPNGSIRMLPSGIDLHSGDLFQATLRYDGTTLAETVTDTVSHATFSTSYAVDIPSLVGGSSGYVGFTASTSTAIATQALYSWQYTPLPAPPRTPVGLTVDPASGTELDVSWSESGSSVDHFNIYRSDGTGGYALVTQVPGAQTYYADGGLTPGATYSYEVVASNLSGDSGIAGPVTATTPVAPNAPLNFTATNITANSVTLTWGSGATNATGYRLMRQIASNNSVLVALLPPDATSYTDATLTPGQVYDYVLSAYNLAGPSTGASVFFRTLPSAPGGVSAVGGSQSVSLNWTASAGATGYNIYRGIQPGGEGVAPVATLGSTTGFTDTGLLAGTVYYYRITAINPWGESAAGGEVSAQTFATNFLNVQAAWQGVTLKRDVDGQHVDWTVGTVSGQMAVDDPFGLTINGFGGNVLVSLDYSGGDPLPGIVHLNGTFTVTGLQGDSPVAGTTLDVGRSTVYFDYSTNPSVAAAVVAALKAGQQAGWNSDVTNPGAGVIESLAAAADPNTFAVGYADAADGTGVDTSANTVEVKFTLNGDANLDGKVLLGDFNNVQTYFGTTAGATWAQGDFNYDGKVLLGDFNVVQTCFGRILANISDAPTVTSPAVAVSTNQTSYTIRGTAGAGTLVRVWLDANGDGVPDGIDPVGSQQLGALSTAFSIVVNLGADAANHFLVTETDGTGKQSAAVAVPTIVQDSTAPSAPSAPILDAGSDTGVSSSDGVTANTSPTFSGTAEAGSRVVLFSDGVAVGSGVADASGKWSVTVGGGDASYAGVTLADGTHSITATAADAADNVSPASVAISVVIDTVKPAAAESYGGVAGSNGWFTSSGLVTLTPSDPSPGSGVAGVTYTVDGGPSVVYTAPFALGGDGAHVVVVTTSDVAGNSNIQAFTVKVDTAGPTLSEAYDGLVGNNGWYVGTGNDTLATADVTSGVGSVTYAIDGGAAVNYAGAFAVTGEGHHTVAVSVTDNAGNVTTDVQSIDIDTVAPVTTASLSGTLGTEGWYTGGSVGVSLAAADATSGVAATFYRVDGGALQTYGGAFAVSGEGSHAVTFYSVDKAGNTEAVGTKLFKIESLSTTAGLSGTEGNDGWYTGAVGVTLTATDTGDGVAATYYSVDGGARQTYGGAFTVSGDGAHSVSYFSVDNAGNVEAAKSVSFKIDGVAPDTAVSLAGTAGANGWYTGGSVEVSLSATDATSGVAATYYSLDGGVLHAYSGPFLVSGDGNHSVSYYSVDDAGNAGAAQSKGVNIDGVAPSTTDVLTGTVGSNGWFTDASVNVSLGATDSTSGVATTYYSVDGGAVQTYQGPFAVSGDGAHSVSYFSVDNAGNVEAAGGDTFKIDSVAPATVESLSGTVGTNGIYTSASVGVTLTASDATSGVGATYYSVDGGGEASYAGGFSVSGEGSHTVTYYSVDQAGNVEAARSRVFTIDSVPPAAPSVPDLAAASDSGSSYTDNYTNVKRPTFTGTAEAGSVVTIRDGDTVVGTTTAAQDGTWSYSVAGDLADGVHAITATATDAAGNTGAASGVLSVTIDTSSPVVMAGGDIAVNSGTAWSFDSGSFVDSGTGGDVWTATVNYGDGSGDQVLVLNGNAFSLAHTWTNAGTDPVVYTVTVKVTDLAGNIGTATFFATVS